VRYVARRVAGHPAGDAHFVGDVALGQLDGDHALELVIGAPLDGVAAPAVSEPVPTDCPDHGPLYVVLGPLPSLVALGVAGRVPEARRMLGGGRVRARLGQRASLSDGAELARTARLSLDGPRALLQELLAASRPTVPTSRDESSGVPVARGDPELTRVRRGPDLDGAGSCWGPRALAAPAPRP